MITIAQLTILCICLLVIYKLFFVREDYYDAPKLRTCLLVLTLVILVRTATNGQWFTLVIPWYIHSAFAIVLLGICCRMNDNVAVRLDDNNALRFLFYWVAIIVSVIQFVSVTYGPVWPWIVSKLGTP